MPPKTVLITGCGQASIGSALAREFRSRGHTVFASNLDLADVDPALSEMGCHVLELDVTSTASIGRAVSVVTSATRTAEPDGMMNDGESEGEGEGGGRGGRLDLLVNNAGIMQIMPFADTPVEDARRVFEVNVLGAWAVTRAFLPLLVAAAAGSSSRQRGGSSGPSSSSSKVANLCSVNEVLCPPFLAAYNASKAALEAVGRTMRRELAPLGVQVVTLKCGSFESGLFNDSDAAAAMSSGPSVPPGSLYAGLREWIAGREFLKEGIRARVGREALARELADELLKEKTSAVVWNGGLATMHWFMSLGWETMFVSARFRAPFCRFYANARDLGPNTDQVQSSGHDEVVTKREMRTRQIPTYRQV